MKAAFHTSVTLNKHLMKARLQVNLAKIISPIKLIEEVIDLGNGKPISVYDLV